MLALGDHERLGIEVTAVTGAAGHRLLNILQLHDVVLIDALHHGVHESRRCFFSGLESSAKFMRRAPVRVRVLVLLRVTGVAVDAEPGQPNSA